jgi:hypothetical protein
MSRSLAAMQRLASWRLCALPLSRCSGRIPLARFTLKLLHSPPRNRADPTASPNLSQSRRSQSQSRRSPNQGQSRAKTRSRSRNTSSAPATSTKRHSAGGAGRTRDRPATWAQVGPTTAPSRRNGYARASGPSSETLLRSIGSRRRSASARESSRSRSASLPAATRTTSVPHTPSPPREAAKGG